MPQEHVESFAGSSGSGKSTDILELVAAATAAPSSQIDLACQAASLVCLGNTFIEAYSHNEPDLILVDEEGDDQLRRWHVVRDRYRLNIYLHQVLKADSARGLHDHPWASHSIILKGVLREVLESGERILYPGSITARSAEELHRLEVVEGPVWTLFITGPKVRDWGFMMPDGTWRHSETMVKIEGKRAYTLPMDI